MNDREKQAEENRKRFPELVDFIAMCKKMFNAKIVKVDRKDEQK
jgi:hypothetical protein